MQLLLTVDHSINARVELLEDTDELLLGQVNRFHDLILTLPIYEKQCFRESNTSFCSFCALSAYASNQIEATGLLKFLHHFTPKAQNQVFQTIVFEIVTVLNLNLKSCPWTVDDP